MEKKKLPLGMIETNCYLIYNEEELLIFDPGDESERLIKLIESLNRKVTAVILTHAHFDHIGAADDVCEHYNVPLYISDQEKYWLTDPVKNGSQKFSTFGIEPIICRTKPQILNTGKMKIGSFEFEVKPAPGHSPGSMIFIFDTFTIAGDTLFKDSIGRTDLYEGNHQQLLNSIQTMMETLPEEMVICPGHGSETTLKREKMMNPFLK